MALIVQFNPDSSPVAGRITRWLASANTPDFEGLANTLINPTQPASGTPATWKVVDGAIVAMTQEDLDAIAAADAAAALAALKDSLLDELNQTSTALPHLFHAVVEWANGELNKLRTIASQPTVTNGNAKLAVLALYQARIENL